MKFSKGHKLSKHPVGIYNGKVCLVHFCYGNKEIHRIKILNDEKEKENLAVKQ